MRPKNLDPRITRVVYRKWPDGDIIALFPDDDWNGFEVSSYMHIGQHGGARYHQVIASTKPATHDEYISLHHELQTRGYVLRVARRR